MTSGKKIRKTNLKKKKLFLKLHSTVYHSTIKKSFPRVETLIISQKANHSRTILIPKKCFQTFPRSKLPPRNFPKKPANYFYCTRRYSESIGFESFSLPLSERDASSPPPTPPVRDASSLKSVCYGPGHEKYPSWPSAPESRRYPDDGADEDVHSGSHRSKSWTDHTNYPKEKPAVYTRPHNKRPNATYTQQVFLQFHRDSRKRLE